MTIGDAFELATNSLFRELSNFATPPRAGRVTALEGSGQVRVETDDPDGGDVLAWPLDSFAYAVNDVVYVAFGVNSPDSAIVLGAKATATTYIRRSGVDSLTANWDIGEDRRILAEAFRARDGEGLALEDDAGTVGLLLEDGGNVVVPNVSGSNVANGDITIQGTTHATRTSSYVIINPNGGFTGFGVSAPVSELHVASSGTAGTRGAVLSQHNSGAQGALLILRKSRGSFGSPSVVATGDFVTAVFADVYDGSSYIKPAGVAFKVNGTVAAGSVPVDLIFAAGAVDDGSFANNEGFRLTSGRLLGLGTSAPQGKFHAHDGTGGAALITKTGVAGSSVVMIPNATGDVTRSVYLCGVMRDSAGSRYDIAFRVDNGSNQNVDDGGGNRLVFTVNANGELSAQRTLGALTYDFTLWCVWQ